MFQNSDNISTSRHQHGNYTASKLRSDFFNLIYTSSMWWTSSSYEKYSAKILHVAFESNLESRKRNTECKSYDLIDKITTKFEEYHILFDIPAEFI